MSRTFSKEVKRAALARAQGKCEAVGPLYGLPEGVRCNASIGVGFEFDHIILWANSRDSSLDNVAVCCKQCHRVKSTKHDTPKAAKTVRQRDKHDGIKNDRQPMAGSRKSKFKRTLDGRTVLR